MQLAGNSLLAQRGRKLLEVAVRAGADERVHARGCKALELTELREDVGARGDEGTGHLLTDDLGGPTLMQGVEVREQEADSNSLDTRPGERAGGLANLRLVELLEHLARRGHDALGDDLAGGGASRTGEPATGCPA